VATLRDVLSQVERVKYRVMLPNRHVYVLPTLLKMNEEIVRILPGTLDTKDGIIVATNSRIIFISKGLIAGQTVETIDYDELKLIEFAKNWKGAQIVAHTGSTIKVFMHVEPSFAEDFTAQVAVAVETDDGYVHRYRASVAVQRTYLRRWRRALIGAVVAPFLLLGIYAALAGRDVFLGLPTDLPAIVLSMLVGIPFLLALPVKGWKRVIAVLLYVPVTLVALVIFSLYLACAYGRCL
jgi:hypothetical protein